MPYPADTEVDLSSAQIVSSQIVSIELFQLDLLACQTIQGHASIHDAASCLLKVSSTGKNGWGVCMLPAGEPRFDFIKWAAVFGKLKGVTVPSALQLVQQHHTDWGTERYTLGKATLTDLVSQCQRGCCLSRQSEVCNGLERSFLIDHSDRYFSFL
ncbi:hypothetical protein [Paenibacillus sp. UNC451MF]|uniref:hypothetical protein n=1 Tax=Paenibacillus sp. UNC451MF TaxID=1449063 RepID=UPI000490AFBA|nr:hypothetical protein [Paenibacillus sp. UNC451MF]